MIQRFLVPLDGSPLAEQALGQAKALARAFDAEVILLGVQETPASPSPMNPISWRLACAETRWYLEGLASSLRDQGLRVTPLVAEGRPADEILQTLRARSVDLIVLCSHGLGGRIRFRLGGTAQKVVFNAGVSVLVVRATTLKPEEPAAPRDFGCILVALDGSQRAQWALCMAAAIARAHHGELLLVHVVETRELEGRMPATPEDQELARKLVERDRRSAELYLAETESLLATSGLQVRTRLVEAPQVVPALENVAAEEGCSLMVVSAHGSSGPAAWLYGSVAERLIFHGKLPLLVFQDLPREEPVESAEAEEPGVRLAMLASV